MEGLAAIGLAGNIVQFITFGFTLVAKSRDIHQSVSGLPDESIDLNLVATDIQGFSTHLTSAKEPSTELVQVAERCAGVAKKLLHAISEIQLKHTNANPGRSSTRWQKWQSFRKALKYIWRKEEIEDLKTRLEALRDQMTMHMVSGIDNEQTKMSRHLAAWEKRNADSDFEFTEQIQGLDTRLQHIQEMIFQVQNDGRWTRLHNDLAAIAQKVHVASQTHTIVASLRYEYMELRHEAIKDAYSRTFNWIYRTQDSSPSDVQPCVNYAEWLRSGDGVYWVTGKPGSGKSTLMKYLYNHDQNANHLRIWAGKVPLVRAHFYFWNPGQRMQKTLEGLLQTLLYHVLQAHPELVSKVCPGRWSIEQSSRGTSSNMSWTLKELKEAFTVFTSQCTVDTKFYFHIDGLDEYSGDCWEVIDTLQHLSTASNVKLCLSSRPWNEFQDAFGRLNPYTLHLHELTREDIKLFARENLRSYTRFAAFQPQLFNELVHSIGEKAQGVFLWVRLAVRSLRDGITNEDPVSILHERLKAIPSDLEDFFEQILSSVDEIYRHRMANTFLATLRSDDPLRIIHYYFLEGEEETHSYKLPASQWPSFEVQRSVQQTIRRLNGRFKGLLEPASTTNVTHQTLVDFLHRTLRDFLIRGHMREKLERWAIQETHVLTSISRAIVAESKFIGSGPSLKQLPLAIRLAEQASNESGNSEHYHAVLDEVEAEYERANICTLYHKPCPDISYILGAAVSLGHVDYVHYRLDRHSTSLDLDRILLHAITCALSPDSDSTYSSCLAQLHSAASCSKHCYEAVRPHNPFPSPQLVRLLLDYGANPNAAIGNHSALHTFLNRMADSLDGNQADIISDIFRAFHEKHLIDGRVNTDIWHRLLLRLGYDYDISIALRNISQYFGDLLEAGFDPNADLGHGISGTVVLLRTLTHTSWMGKQSEVSHLLFKFLRHGADITQVYRDVSGRGWLDSVCDELTHRPTTWLGSSRNAELEIFLQHGLEPNSAIPESNGAATIWTRLLKALDLSFRKANFDRTHQQIMRRTVILCLKYGADPYASRLPGLLKWMEGAHCRLSTSEVSELQRIVAQEKANMESRLLVLEDPGWTTQSRPTPIGPRAQTRSQIAYCSREENKRSIPYEHDNIRAQHKRRRYG